MGFKQSFGRLRLWLAGLSFRTGVAVACCCLLCYSLSFGQMLLPVSAETKVILWTILFGLAKALQYSAIAILGKSGITRLKSLLSARK